MRRWFFLFLLFFPVTCFNALSKNIQQIDSIKQAKDVLSQADSQTLVVFDINNTLIMQEKNVSQGKVIRSRKPKNFSYKVVEDELVTVIHDLQARGVKVIALTSVRPSSYGSSSQVEEWRFSRLLEVGVDFTSSFQQEEIILKDLSPLKGKHAVFYKGILFAAGNAKGKVLGVFLDKIGWQPSRVIFFDDIERFVNSVAEEMAQKSVPFFGYVYRAAFK